MASTKYLKLVGYILPPKTDNADEESLDDEVEEENVPQFLDMKEMDCLSSGGFMFHQSLPETEEVDFMFHGKKVRVKGRFPLRNPWWEISCNAKQYSRKLVCDGYPAYKLRTDLENDWDSIVSLFLKECDVDPIFVTKFMKWLPKSRYMDLINILEAVHKFGESTQMVEAADFAKYKISKSDASFPIRAAASYPNIMKFLPTLLPGQFLSLLQKGKEEEEEQQSQNAKEEAEASSENCRKVLLLARLEELIKSDEVWKFGFGYIMYKEFRLLRCETKLNNFMSCELFSKISPVQQDALKVYNELKVYCSRFGHTYVVLKVLMDKMRLDINVCEAVDFLCKYEVVLVKKEKISLRNLYKYENDIAECLHQLIVGEPWKIGLDVKEVLCSVDLDPDQVDAAEMMCANPVTVISGRGGCGKTTVVTKIFKAAMEQQEKNREDIGCSFEENKQEENGKKPVEVLLTAPTGRAASLLTKKTCFEAYTIHQVLWSYKLTKKGPNGELLNWKFASVRVLVVDEGSLVCVQILSSILSMLTKHAQLQKFIILGDIWQLPSIAPGNVLNDLFTSLKKVNWAIEMRTNHRAESKLIVQNAGLIADMGVNKKFNQLNYDTSVKLDKSFIVPSPDKSFIEICLPINVNSDDLQISIKRLLSGLAPGLEDHASSQFIAFKRSECALVNELCCKHYCNHTTKTYQNKMNFQIGDKVCCSRNGYVKDKDKEEEEEAKTRKDDMDGSKIIKERLCNGEIFFITQDVTVIEDIARKSSKRRYLTLDDKQGKMLTVEYRELMRECKLRHAWARTIHTFQGSEEKTIVYVLDNGDYQSWKHVYTAVTRGQSRVYVIAKRDGLENAIRGRVIKRNTRLEGLVMDMLRDLDMVKKDFLSQPSQCHFKTPKRGSGFQTLQSTQVPSSSPGSSESCAFGSLGSPKTASPRQGKRECVTENCITATKQMKLDSPLGSTRLQHLSLNSVTPRKLFLEPPQSQQDE